jgi:hypothetical protein
LRGKKIYEGLNLTGACGLVESQKQMLLQLGAVADYDEHNEK